LRLSTETQEKDLKLLKASRSLGHLIPSAVLFVVHLQEAAKNTQDKTIARLSLAISNNTSQVWVGSEFKFSDFKALLYLSASTLPTLALSSSLSDFSNLDLNEEI